MPGYGGGIGGDDAPGNEAGAGGGSGMGGGMGGIGGGGSRGQEARDRQDRAREARDRERAQAATRGFDFSRLNEILSDVFTPTRDKPGILGAIPGMSMLTNPALAEAFDNLSMATFGVPSGPPGSSFDHDSRSYGPGPGERGGESIFKDPVGEVEERLGIRPVTFDVRGWGSSPPVAGAEIGPDPLFQREGPPMASSAAEGDGGGPTPWTWTLPKGQQWGAITPFGAERWIGKPGGEGSTRIVELHPDEQARLDRARALRARLSEGLGGLIDRFGARYWSEV